MELFIPSFAAFLILLLVGILAFLILPKFAPLILVSGSGAVLAMALYIHWSRFGREEYERSTWQNNLKQYGGFIVIGAILLMAYGFYALNQGPSSVVPASLSDAVASVALPPVAAPAVGGGFQTVARTASSRLRELFRSGRISHD